MATIKRIEVQLSLLPLLSGGIEVQRFVLIEPDVLLEKNAKGKGNWEIGAASAPVQDQGSDGESANWLDRDTILRKMADNASVDVIFRNIGITSHLPQNCVAIQPISAFTSLPLGIKLNVTRLIPNS